MRHLIGHGRLIGLVSFCLVATIAVGAAPVRAAADPTPATDLLQRAAKTMGGVKSFHFVLSNEVGTTVLMEGIALDSAEGDVQRPDRFQVEAQAKLGVVPLQVRLVGIGGRVWFSNPLSGNQYQEVSGGQAIAALLDPTPLLLAAVTMVQDAKITGEEKLDGVKATRIEGTVNLQQVGTPVPGLAPAGALPAQIWLDAAGHVVRLRLEGALTTGEEPDVVRVLDLSRFDKPVDIQPPPGV